MTRKTKCDKRRTLCIRLDPETIDWLNANVPVRKRGRFFDAIVQTWKTYRFDVVEQRHDYD